MCCKLKIFIWSVSSATTKRKEPTTANTITPSKIMIRSILLILIAISSKTTSQLLPEDDPSIDYFCGINWKEGEPSYQALLPVKHISTHTNSLSLSSQHILQPTLSIRQQHRLSTQQLRQIPPMLRQLRMRRSHRNTLLVWHPLPPIRP